MIATDFKLPEKDSALILIPSYKKIPDLIQANRTLFTTWDFTIGTIPAFLFRKKVRESAFETSDFYSNRTFLKRLEKTRKTYDKDSIIIQTGHQPGFPHPGIMSKYFLLNSLIERLDCIGINLIVDSDSLTEITAEIPNIESSPAPATTHLLTLPYPTPFELIPSPELEQLDNFFMEISKKLDHPLFKNLKRNFENWKNSIKNLQLDQFNMADLLTSMRHIFEKQRKLYSEYYELPISRLSETPFFYDFFLHIVARGREFALIFNRQLNLYRRLHKLRYRANPFPDLKINDEFVELPFWNIRNNKRERVIMKTAKDNIILNCGGEDLIELPLNAPCNSSEVLKKIDIKIRPRAITLTMFNRMFLSDIFIHGIGGSKYDRVTDGIIREFFHVEPPGYITVSLTKYPDVTYTDRSKKIQGFEIRLRDMRYNPDRYIENKHTHIHLAEKKKSLLREIKKEGAEKKTIGNEINNINKKLISSLSSYIRRIEKELADLKKEQSVWDSVHRRDYPYFLFTAEELFDFRF